jgi:hypothetical protein
MKKKLLIVNLQNPKDSRYFKCDSWAASYMLGRRLSNYLFLSVNKEDGSSELISIPDDTADIFVIEKILKDALNKT